MEMHGPREWARAERRALRGEAACLEARRYADRVVLCAKVGLELRAARDAEGGPHLAPDAADLVDHLAASVKVDLRDGEGGASERESRTDARRGAAER